MFEICVALAAIAFYTASLYGWGLAARRILQMSAEGHWAVTVAIGLSFIVFLGGILNVSHIATSAPLITITLVGAALWILFTLRKYRRFADIHVVVRDEWQRTGWSRIASYTLIGAILVAVLATQLSPQAYNFHDDFEKYFAYPVRMLQTGTLAGSALNAMGYQTLGGQALLHGAVLAAFPITYINSVDAVFGLFLCMLLISSFSGETLRHLPFTLLTILASAFINPQYVNISTLYLMSAAALCLVALCTDTRELNSRDVPHPAAMGLIYAAGVALKTTFAAFIAAHVVLVVLTLAIAFRSSKKGLSWAAITGLYSGLFLSPWLLLQAGNVVGALQHPSAEAVLPPAIAGAPFSIFSIGPLLYGSSAAHYTGLVIIMVMAAAMSFWVSRGIVETRVRIAIYLSVATVIAATVTYFFLLFISAPQLSGPRTGIRYFTPFAIALVPAAVGLAVFHIARAKSRASTWWKYAALAVLAVIPIIIFAPSVGDRWTQARTFGSVLAFSKTATSPFYISYNDNVLRGAAQKTLAEAQAVVPDGEALIAWVSAPFYLDYARNDITDVNPGGLAAPWARAPDAKYFIYQESGFAVRPMEELISQSQRGGLNDRTIGVRMLNFYNALSRTDGEVLYKKDGITVLRLNTPLQLQ